MQPNTQGMLFLAASSLSFAIMGLIAHLVQVPFWEQTLMRGSVTLLLVFPMAYRHGFSLWGKTPGWLWLRSLAGSCALFGFFYALQHIHLADATLLTYINPLWISLLAPFVLNERAHWRRLLAVAIGLAGLALVLGPSGQWLSWGGLAGIVAGISSAIAHMAVRKLRNDHPSVVVSHFALSSALLSLPGALYVGRLPVGLEWLSLAGIGLFATLGQYCMTRGYQSVEASTGSIMSLLTPVFATLFSLFLQEPLGLYQLLGSALVMLTAVYLSRQTREESFEGERNNTK